MASKSCVCVMLVEVTRKVRNKINNIKARRSKTTLKMNVFITLWCYEHVHNTVVLIHFKSLCISFLYDVLFCSEKKISLKSVTLTRNI